MIGREEARLHALFRRLLVVSIAAAPACSTSGSNANDAGSAATDGTVVTTDAPGDDGSDASPALEDASALDSTLADAGGATDGAPDVYGFTDPACVSVLDSGPDSDGCQFYEALPCGLPPNTSVESCYLTYLECATLCNQVLPTGHPCGVAECLAEDAGSAAWVPDGAITLECTTGLAGCAPGVGRRPEGLGDAPPATPATGRDAAGAWLAGAARLEGASVHAFRRLARELVAMRAPRALVRAAQRSARDEVRHARVTTRLARRRGAQPARVRVAAAPAPRSVESFALENVVEGCVRECFGALVATHQAMHARDPEVAAAMTRIARDETRHAALAWEIARWLAPRLDSRARHRMNRAARGAIASLRCELAGTPPVLVDELGLPAGAEVGRLIDGFAAALLG